MEEIDHALNNGTITYKDIAEDLLYSAPMSKDTNWATLGSAESPSERDHDSNFLTILRGSGSRL